jgi:hypothetical protein
MTSPSLRESLADWTDIDVIQHQLATAIGVVEAHQSLNDVKALYWTKNPVGDALASFVFALAQAGVLEAQPDDETVLRWNPAYQGFVPNKKPQTP